MLAERRLRDWVALLDFEVADVYGYLGALPMAGRAPDARRSVRRNRAIGGARRLTAGGYLLKARKRVQTLTLVRPSRRVAPARPGAARRNPRAKCGPVTQVEIYTDGACRGNPGPGGWAALLIAGSERKELSGAEAETTNNRMELMAAISGLGALKRRCAVKLYTDSKYVLQGLTEWLPQWKARGWRTAAREPVKNQDLWEKLDAAAAAQDIEWHWVKGHSGHEGNEYVDAARQSGDRSDAGGALKTVARRFGAGPLMRQVVLDTETTGLEVEHRASGHRDRLRGDSSTGG